MSPGGAVTSTGRSKLPIRVSDATSDVSTGGVGGGGGGGLTETPIAPFIPSCACPGTEHRKRNVPLRGNDTVIVWRCLGRSTRVRFFCVTTKSWTAVPRLRTTNRTVEPAGTLRRESEKA